MSNTITWKKKNGNKMTTNDLPATIKYMESLGATSSLVKSIEEDEKQKPVKNNRHKGKK